MNSELQHAQLNCSAPTVRPTSCGCGFLRASGTFWAARHLAQVRAVGQCAQRVLRLIERNPQRPKPPRSPFRSPKLGSSRRSSSSVLICGSSASATSTWRRPEQPPESHHVAVFSAALLDRVRSSNSMEAHRQSPFYEEYRALGSSTCPKSRICTP